MAIEAWRKAMSLILCALRTALAMAGLFVGSLATGTITVSVVTQSGQNAQISSLAGHTTSPYNITFTVEPVGAPASLSSPVVRVQADNGETITSVVVKVDLPVTDSRVNLVVNGVGTGLSSMGSIAPDGMSSGELWVQSITARDGVFGAISANRVLRVETTQSGSDITADIVETTGTIGFSGSPVVISANRHILGDITLRSPVNTIEALTGNIGSSGTPVSISVANAVDLIEADAIWANIDLVVGTAHDLGRLETRSGDFVGAGSGIDGLEAGDIGAGGGRGIFIAGDLDAEVSIATLDAPFIIDGDLVSGRTITISQDLGLDLEGQITMNYANGGGAWDGTVVVGNTSPITLTSPNYTNSAASMGGGSIGEAAFYLHENSCSPPEGGSVATRTPDLTSILIPPPCDEHEVVIKLRFKGTVFTRPGAGADEIVKVEEYNSGMSSWDDVTSSFVAYDAASPLSASRIIYVDPSGGPLAWSPGAYRMTTYYDEFDDSNILCEVTTGTSEARDFTYIVHVTDDCEEWLLARFDVDDDNDLTYEGDVSEWLLNPVDFTDDQVADEDDMEALLTAIEQFNE